MNKPKPTYLIVAIGLSLTAIVSTTAPEHWQSQSVLGVPLFLLFWILLSVLICLTTIVMGLKFYSAISPKKEAFDESLGC